MACLQQPSINLLSPLVCGGVEEWYAVHTRARHEKKVVALLKEKQVSTYLPVISSVRRWSDRRVKIEFPLFPCYTFVKIDDSAESRLKVLRTPGVLRIVSCGYEPVSIPEKQIEDIQLLLSHQVPFWEHPFVSAGQRVRVRGGIFDGLEGILTSCNSDRKLVVSISPIQRSIAIRLGDAAIEPVH
jgi:transcription antitermination factor NusG